VLRFEQAVAFAHITGALSVHCSRPPRVLQHVVSLVALQRNPSLHKNCSLSPELEDQAQPGRVKNLVIFESAALGVAPPHKSSTLTWYSASVRK